MKYLLAFNGGIYEKQANALRDRIGQILLQADCENLTVLFSSEGGSTDSGLALYNVIRSLPKPIHIHSVGHVGSMAIPVFLAGHKRTCSPQSRFFFHAYDWGFEGRQISDRITEAMQRLTSDIALSKQIAQRHTTIPTNQLDELYRNSPTPTIFSPEQAKAVGIVEDIIELNPTGAAQPNTVMWTVNW